MTFSLTFSHFLPLTKCQCFCLCLPVHVFTRVFQHVHWRAIKALESTLLCICRSSRVISHICAVQKTCSELWRVLETSSALWPGQSKNPDGGMDTRVQERTSGRINQELATTTRTSTDPTRTALPPKRLCPALAVDEERLHQLQRRAGNSHPLICSGHQEKQENHHRLLLSDALCFSAKEAPLQHLAITGAWLTGAAGPRSHNSCWSTHFCSLLFPKLFVH